MSSNHKGAQCTWQYPDLVFHIHLSLNLPFADLVSLLVKLGMKWGQSFSAQSWLLLLLLELLRNMAALLSVCHSKRMKLQQYLNFKHPSKPCQWNKSQAKLSNLTTVLSCLSNNTSKLLPPWVICEVWRGQNKTTGLLIALHNDCQSVLMGKHHSHGASQLKTTLTQQQN